MMKAIVLTTSTGGGHNAAARAVAEALERKGVEAQVRDCVAVVGKGFSRGVSSAYVRLVQWSPRAFGRVYRIGRKVSDWGHVSPVYLFNASYAARMRGMLEAEKPDMVVCTHLFAGQTLTHLRKHGQVQGLTAFVMTDYTVIPFQQEVACDLLFVSHPDLEEDCRQKGVDMATVRPWGIPVSAACKPCTDKAQAKRDAGLPPERPEVLLAGGSMGAGNLPATIRALLPTLGSRGHVTVVCGSNAKARADAEASFGHHPQVTVLGEVHPLTGLMAACDVLVSKSGGLTSTEAMTIGVPFVVYNAIEGCETLNAALFERHGMAAWAHTEEELQAQVTRLLSSDEARAEMLCCQRREIDPNAADRIAEELILRTKEKEQNEY